MSHDNILHAATDYQSRGWQPVPLPARSKAPVLPGWQRLRTSPDQLPALFDGAGGVGLLLGAPSGGLVDVDLDVPEAGALAGYLPDTDMIHGRTSRPSSHYWYLCSPPPERTAQFKDPIDGQVLLELRSTGGQTMVPPSVHPSGEQLVWEREGGPAEDCPDVVLHGVGRVAALTLLARHWPLAEERRSDYAMAVLWVLEQGQPAEWARPYFESIARVAGDQATLPELWDDDGCYYRSLSQDRRPDERVIHPRVLQRALDWFWGAASPRSSPPSGAAPSPADPGCAPAHGGAAQDGDQEGVAALRGLVGQLPAGAPTWTWLGWAAARAGVVTSARALLSDGEEQAAAYDQGASAPAGAKFKPPVDNSGLVKRIRRALERLALPAQPEGAAAVGGLEVRRVVHYRRPRCLGGTYDVEVATPTGAVVVRGLSGSDLRSYGKVADAALACGLLLPVLPPKKANATWADLLAGALATREVVELPEAAEVEVLLEDEVRAAVAESPRGSTVAELDQGLVVERGALALIAVRSLVRRVKGALRDEPVARGDVLRAVQALGGQVHRSYWFAEEALKRAVVAFPLAAPQAAPTSGEVQP